VCERATGVWAYQEGAAREELGGDRLWLVEGASQLRYRTLDVILCAHVQRQKQACV